MRGASSNEGASRARRRRGRSSGQGDAPSFDDSMAKLYVFMLILLLTVAARLVWFQVIKGHEYSAAAQNHRTFDIALHAHRGTIYDRNGNALAISIDAKTVCCDPSQVNDPSAVTTLLVKHLGGERGDYLGMLCTDDSFCYIARAIDVEKAEALEKELDDNELTGVYFVDDTRRDYPYGDVAGQLLGIVGIDGDGLTGLEYYYDDILKGEDGTMVVETGLDGIPIAGAKNSVQEAKDGSDIVTSIDIDTQMVAESKIAEATKEFKAESGSVVVTDPRTGEILAACSTPLLPISNYDKMEEGSENLKPVNSAYEPGSIFKILTSAIGINHDDVTPWTTYTVPAEVKVGSDYVSDDDGRDYTMTMSLTEMMRRSSNAGMATVAQESIGARAFAKGVESFGIGQKTGIDFPGEEVGIVRPLESYDGSTLGSMSFGQGLAIPMIQMVRAVGVVANGGYLCTPHFAVSKGGEDVEWPKSEQIISKQTCDETTQMMRTVVREGTAVNANVDGYDVAGKTGTGEQAGEDGSYKANCFVSSLVGFAPASDPAVLVYVGLNYTPYLAYGSAAPTFSYIMNEALTNMGVPPEY